MDVLIITIAAGIVSGGLTGFLSAWRTYAAARSRDLSARREAEKALASQRIAEQCIVKIEDLNAMADRARHTLLRVTHNRTGVMFSRSIAQVLRGELPALGPAEYIRGTGADRGRPGEFMRIDCQPTGDSYSVEIVDVSQERIRG